jgi:hypothetical protein
LGREAQCGLPRSDRTDLLTPRPTSPCLGRLVLPPHIPGSANGSAPLTHLPIALYTLLLGIPASELSRKPPAASATKTAASPFPAARALDGALDALSLAADADEDDVFGERQEEEEAVGGFIGGRDLEVLKVAGQALETLDLELGLFGGMRALDVRLPAPALRLFGLPLIAAAHLPSTGQRQQAREAPK